MLHRRYTASGRMHQASRLAERLCWGVDLLTWLPPLEAYRIVFSFSPCDDTAVSGCAGSSRKGFAPSVIPSACSRGMDIGKWSVVSLVLRASEKHHRYAYGA